MNPRHLVLETNVLPLNYTPILDVNILTDFYTVFNPFSWFPIGKLYKKTVASATAPSLYSTGAQSRNRTSDTQIFSLLLYRLSYLGKFGGPSGTRTLDLPVMSREL